VPATGNGVMASCAMLPQTSQVAVRAGWEAFMREAQKRENVSPGCREGKSESRRELIDWLGKEGEGMDRVIEYFWTIAILPIFPGFRLGSKRAKGR